MKKIFSLLIILLLISSPCWGGVIMDGSGDIIDFGDNVEPGAITIGVWAYFTEAAVAAERAILSKGYGLNDPWVSYYFAWETDETVRMMAACNGGSAVFCNLGTVLTNNTWYYLAMSYSDASNDLDCYVYNTSGTLVDSDTQSGTSGVIAYSAQSLRVGRQRDGDADFGYGGVGDFSVWDAKLNADYFVFMASSHGKRISLQVQPANLIFYAPLDECGDGATPCTTAGMFKDIVGGVTGTGEGNLTGKAEVILSYP